MKLENLSLASIAAVVFTLILGFALIQINANAVMTVQGGGGGGGSTCGVYVAISPVTTLELTYPNTEALVVPYVVEVFFYGGPNGVYQGFGPNFNANVVLAYWNGNQYGYWNDSIYTGALPNFYLAPGKIYNIDNSTYTQTAASHYSIYSGNTYLDVISTNSTAVGQFVTLQVLQKVTCPS